MSDMHPQREQARCRAVVGRMLSVLTANNEEFRNALAHDAEGRSISIPALPSDSLRDLSFMASRAGGEATIAVPVKSRSDGVELVLVGMTVRRDGNNPNDHHLPTGPDSTIGDVLKLLVPGSSMTYRLADGSDELLFCGIGQEDVSDCDGDLIPAL
jgi:hypothetical protein